MMHWIPRAGLAVLCAILSACAAVPAAPGRKPVAKVERVDGFVRLVLIPKAVERIGLETAPVEVVASGGNESRVIPYGALVYDTEGDTFVYTNPAANTYVRAPVKVQTIRGDRVALSDGPPVGVAIVTVGASQLLGIELGIGT
jgi:multidrug efflux pump subunit AcrA (membrane-fusion protein)